MASSSRMARFRALRQRLTSKYGLAGTVLGSFIIFFGVFVLPFSAVMCVGCAMPVVAALGLTGTVAGLAGKNIYVIGVGVVLLAASGYHLYRKRGRCERCESKRR